MAVTNRSRSKIVMQDAEGYYDEAGRYWGDSTATAEWRSVWNLNWQVANNSFERRRNLPWPGVIEGIRQWAAKVWNTGLRLTYGRCDSIQN